LFHNSPILTNPAFCDPAPIATFGSLFLLANHTLWTHLNALDISKPPNPSPCPEPPISTGLAVPDQILCLLVNFFTLALRPPVRAHTAHFLVQIPAVFLPFIVEGTRTNASVLISHFIIGTMYQLKGAGMITPLGFLLTLWLTSSVRDPGTKRGTTPLTQRQVQSVLVSLLLGFVFPSVMMVVTEHPFWIAFWQPFPWWTSAVQTLYLLLTPESPPSSPSSKPGSGLALFKFTLYALSTAGAIAHWTFLYQTFTSPSFSLSSLFTFSWLPSLSIPPRNISRVEAIAHFLEWDAVMCYSAAFLGGLWLLNLARMKTTSESGWVSEVFRKFSVGVVAGPGAMLYSIWGEREDALVHAWKAEGENNK
jgi:hypothetical protein